MFVRNYPAMKIGEYLVITDLHLGVTKEIYESGIFIPYQVKKLAERLNKLKRKTRTKHLVILGDIKHKMTGISFQEIREIPNFLSLLNFKNTILIKGNHDGYIEKLVPSSMKKKVHIRKAFVIDGYFLTHGHTRVKTKKDNIIIGHIQPHIKFIDKLGAVYTEPVWVQGPLKDGKNLIIVPAFNELRGATIINEDKFIGPVAKNIIKNKTHAYLLDGIDIGTLNDLKINIGD